LQIAEEKIGHFEKLLVDASENDPDMKAKLREMHFSAPTKERKITNVVLENNQLRQ
jgi:hypothetical protein